LAFFDANLTNVTAMTDKKGWNDAIQGNSPCSQSLQGKKADPEAFEAQAENSQKIYGKSIPTREKNRRVFRAEAD